MAADRSELDDRELMDLIRRGDPHAEHDLYVRHVDSAMRAATRLGAQLCDAEDFVHDAFIRVLGQLRQGKGPDALFRPYLHTAVRNVAADAHRGRRARELPTVDYGALARHNLVRLEPPEEVEIRTSVQAAMALLPLGVREMLWRLDVEGYPAADVAEDVGVSAETIASRAYRARRALRRAFEVRG